MIVERNKVEGTAMDNVRPQRYTGISLCTDGAT